MPHASIQLVGSETWNKPMMSLPFASRILLVVISQRVTPAPTSALVIPLSTE